jgi:hypothetical protein
MIQRTNISFSPPLISNCPRKDCTCFGKPKAVGHSYTGLFALMPLGANFTQNYQGGEGNQNCPDRPYWRANLWRQIVGGYIRNKRQYDGRNRRQGDSKF